MSKKRKKTLQAPSKLTLGQIRAFTPLEFSQYTKKQLRTIEKKVIRSQNEKIKRIQKAGFGVVGRTRDYIKKGKKEITPAPINTKKDNLIGRIMGINQLIADPFASVKTLDKGYKKYMQREKKRYGDLTEEQYSKTADLWYNYRNDRFAYKFSSESVYEAVQEYLSNDETEDILNILTKLSYKKGQEKEILEAKEKSAPPSRIPDPYSPKDI